MRRWDCCRACGLYFSRWKLLAPLLLLLLVVAAVVVVVAVMVAVVMVLAGDAPTAAVRNTKAGVGMFIRTTVTLTSTLHRKLQRRIGDPTAASAWRYLQD